MSKRSWQKNSQASVIALIVPLLANCGTPPFQFFGNHDIESEHLKGPPLELFLQHMRCEAYRTVLNAYNNRGQDITSWRTVQYLYWYAYQALGQITLDVTVSEGISPSVSDIMPFKHVATGLTLTLGGNINGVQHRNIQENIALDYQTLFVETNNPNRDEAVRPIGTPLSPGEGIISADPSIPADPRTENPFENPLPAHLKTCASVADGTGINGDLGLSVILDYGLTSFRRQDKLVSPGFVAGSSVSSNVFGSQIDFTVAEGVSVGPTWTLIHFKGPSGGGGGAPGGVSNQGLINANRSAKDTLLISFAPACRQPNTPKQPYTPVWESKLGACSANPPPKQPSEIELLQSIDNNLRAILQGKTVPKAARVPPVAKPEHFRPSSDAPPSDEQRLRALESANQNNIRIQLQNLQLLQQP